MIHILLTILKIIAILLVVILGMLLFIPVRYHGRGSRRDAVLKGQLTISWVGHLVHFRMWYPGNKEEKTEMELFLFGLPLGRMKRFFTRRTPLKKPKAVLKAEAAQESENVPKQISEADFHAKTDAKEEQKENAVWKTLEKAADRIKALGNLPGFIGRAIRKIYLTIREIYDRIKEWNRFVARTLLLQQTKRLLKHIAPVKIRGNLHFGFADPSVTGNTLAAIALFYPVLPKKLFIVPDFQNKILEGELDFKGRIYGIILVIVFCKIWFNKDIQRFRKKSRRSKK